jgi:tRNA G18 (ribose-2'-O)-methylase SpoU
LIRVTDPNDPAVAEFRSIRERDLVRNSSQFIAEGTVVLNMLAAAHQIGNRFRAEKILVLENRVEGIARTLAAFPPDVPVYTATAEVIDAIAGFHLHRGVLALGHRLPAPPLAAALAALGPKALVTVCSGISNHDNAGAIFRNSAAFGSDLVVLDDLSCNPLYRKAIRVSVGSVLTVPFHHGGSTQTVLQDLDDAGFQVWGLSPAGTANIRDIPANGRMALLLGTEGEGLPQDLLSRLKTARISQKPGLDSLNVATAGAIALYEISSRMGLL